MKVGTDNLSKGGITPGIYKVIKSHLEAITPKAAEGSKREPVTAIFAVLELSPCSKKGKETGDKPISQRIKITDKLDVFGIKKKIDGDFVNNPCEEGDKGFFIDRLEEDSTQAISARGGWGIFAASLDNAGVDTSEMEDFRSLVGLVAHFEAEAQSMSDGGSWNALVINAAYAGLKGGAVEAGEEDESDEEEKPTPQKKKKTESKKKDDEDEESSDEDEEDADESDEDGESGGDDPEEKATEILTEAYKQAKGNATQAEARAINSAKKIEDSGLKKKVTALLNDEDFVAGVLKTLAKKKK